jgi:hypothetical protein
MELIRVVYYSFRFFNLEAFKIQLRDESMLKDQLRGVAVILPITLIASFVNNHLEPTATADSPSTTAFATPNDVPLRQELNEAKSAAATAKVNRAKAQEAVLSSLRADTDYCAASAKATTLKHQLEQLRTEESPNIPEVSQQWILADGEVRAMETDALQKSAAFLAADQQVAKYDELVKNLIQQEASSSVAPSTRPCGFTDAQWLLAKAIVDYQGEAPRDLAETNDELSKAQNVTYFDGSGFLHSNTWVHVPPSPALHQRVQGLSAIVRQQRLGQMVVPDLYTDQIKIGEVGQIANTIYPIGDPHSHIILIHLDQILDDDNMLATMGDQDIWIAGMSTAGLVDDQDIRISGIFYVSGTRTYDTVLGAQRTVLLMETVDDTNIKMIVDYLLANNSQGSGN